MVSHRERDDRGAIRISEMAETYFRIHHLKDLFNPKELILASDVIAHIRDIEGHEAMATLCARAVRGELKRYKVSCFFLAHRAPHIVRTRALNTHRPCH